MLKIAAPNFECDQSKENIVHNPVQPPRYSITGTVCTTILGISAYMLMADAAYAAKLSILCTAYNKEASDIVDAISTIGVVSVGIGAALGKVSWSMAIMVAVGIATMAGVSTLVADLGGVSC